MFYQIEAAEKVAFLVSGSSGLSLRVNVSLVGTKVAMKNYIMEGRKAKKSFMKKLVHI